MNQAIGQRRPLRLRTMILLLMLSCGLLTAQAWPIPAEALRLSAQRRWAQRSFANYRISLRVNYWDTTCIQELEVQGEHLSRVLRNDCRLSWLSLMSVARLFEISESLEHPMPCYIAAQSCSCSRISMRATSFDAQLGYPRLIVFRRETYPNLVHADYWRRLWRSRQLPDCGVPSPQVKVVVTSLKPLE